MVREFAKFGIIGIINTIVDIGLWNLLYPIGEVKAKILSSLIAAISAFYMNRYWTFRHRSRQTLRREYTLFFIFNGIGMAIQTGAITLAKYGFHITDRLWLNVINVFAIALGTIFRFWSYRRWVWLLVPNEPIQSEATQSAATPGTEASGERAHGIAPRT